MAAFASPEWIAELDVQAQAARVPADFAIVIEQRVDDVSWHFVIADGRVRVLTGSAENPTIMLSSDQATAEAIQRGELSAQRAFLDGAFRIGGDVNALMTHRPLLTTLGELLTAAT
ncbi:MAG: hypothetical protein ACI9C1_002417 [Candidatus Aldehydirespiratoraceae bacterium]